MNYLSPIRIRLFVIGALLTLVSACGGGSGSDPLPTVLLNVNNSASNFVALNGQATLSWSTADAKSCNASGAWSGDKGINGSETLTMDVLGDQSFTLTCLNASGSTTRSAQIKVYRVITGVVVDGYITGSTVFSDTNGNLKLDEGEESVTSASDGSFTLDAGNGNVVSLGGFDTDMSSALDDLLLITPLRESQAEAVVSPITTIASFMENPEDLNAILGVDASIDLMTTDPVAKKGTSAEYDLLYEKGNQLTVLAYSLQSATGETGDTSEDAFSSITRVLEESYEADPAPVDIESSEFIEEVVDTVVETTQATVSTESKANVTKALVNVLPLIQVREDNSASQSILNFATDTLVKDIQSLADGTASAETVQQYETTPTSYIATAQGGNPADYAISIKAVADEVTLVEDGTAVIKIVANDDYLSDGGAISITLTDASYGSLTLDADNQVTYTPVADYTGADSFSYTLVQGDRSSTAEVKITVSSVADSPKLTIDSTSFTIAENTSAVGTFKATDADGDTLTYSLSGTDAEKFTISSTGELKFTAAADYETKSSYTVNVVVSDGLQSVTKELTVALTNVIESPPSLSLPTTVNVAENSSVVTQAVATDPEGSALTYKLSGTDAATFYITSSGLVSFRTVPDYESLTQTQYNITVTVTNAGSLAVSGAIVVNVTDISESFFDTCRFGECKFE